MARFIRAVEGYNMPVAVAWRVLINQTIKEGDLVELDSTTRQIKSANPGDTTYVGIAMEDITTGGTVTPDDKIMVLPITNCVIRMDYAGTTKTSLADTDLVTTLFDISNPRTINLDDVTGGSASVVGYDNARKWADVIISDTHIKKLG